MWVLLGLVSGVFAAGAPSAANKTLEIKGVSRDMSYQLGPKNEKEQIHFIKPRTSYLKEALEQVL
jgi:hypothetical protein